MSAFANHAVVRESSAPEVYVLCDGVKVHVPTPSALFHLGYTWANVQVVPDGSLSGLPRQDLPSLSATPPSMVFPMHISNGETKWWPRRELPGVTLPNGNHVGELEGLMLSVGDGCNGVDPDWHMTFSPTPACLDKPGVDPNRLFRVGDILTSETNVINSDHHAFVAMPVFNIELSGWPATNVLGGGGAKPDDWVTTNMSGCPQVFWPFDPQALRGAVAGRSVRVSGVLVTDDPHTRTGNTPWEKNYRDAAEQWQGATGPYDENNPARYTEIHSPDLIDLSSQSFGEPLYGVAVSARTALSNPSGADQELTATLKLQTPRPKNAVAGVDEYVLPETYVPSIVEGNVNLNGARITSCDDSVEIHVKVHGEPFQGHAGRFAAIYRLKWTYRLD
jgi:hypothetical protein